MKIEILGTGCRRCDELHANAVSAASALGDRAPIEVIKVGDPAYFLKLGVFMTPGLVINGKVIAVGKLLSVEEIEERIRENL